MAAQDLILVENLCSHYEIEITFFNALNKIGLIEIKTIKQKQFVHQDQISALEKIIRLHHELDVNIEGIDIVFNLLQKLDELRNELNSVKNRLKIYENDE
jgi:hypothetical protein